MKKTLSIVFLCLLGMIAHAQKKGLSDNVIKYPDNVNEPLTLKEKSYINVVYGNYANDFIYNNAHRLKTFKNILRNRVVVEHYPKKDLSNVPKLSSVLLVNAINTKLQKELSFNPSNFNALKYSFNFFSNDSVKHYHVDNTQYLITIYPQF